jgi:hypothetical protein
MSHIYVRDLSTAQLLELFNKYSPKPATKFESRKVGIERLKKVLSEHVFGGQPAVGDNEVIYTVNHLRFDHEALEFISTEEGLAHDKAAAREAKRGEVKTDGPVETAVKEHDTKAAAKRTPKAKDGEKKTGVGKFIAAQLRAGKNTDGVLEAVRAEYPESKATSKDVSIARSKIKKGIL